MKTNLMKNLTVEQKCLLFCFFISQAIEVFESLDDENIDALLLAIGEQCGALFEPEPARERESELARVKAFHQAAIKVWKAPQATA